ncbi:Tubulin/FtsZ family, GTPase domain-containing protein [Scheffersomyces amazonensis]|uniref:Tubulin/FtsZ family, GTPase domain-containing protein n=1 Tax=Scheffersomyces amazonensis TaxID=1078765 RepID=UPI00315DB75A
MPGETITLQAGQCGNQVGLQYWHQLAQEHGIQPDGTPLAYPIDNSLTYQQEGEELPSTTTKFRDDRPELFYTISDTNKYTPRSILIDLEPSVINKCANQLPMFNPRNIHLSEQGSGAANNWKNGYSYGVEYQEDLLNLIDREMDKCDNLSNFQLIHSVAGGTGSGVGSLLLELLHDRFGNKKLINTFSIFPSNEKTSDVVVQPYNTVLTLKRLIDFSDSSFIFHNDSLNSIENLLLNNYNNSRKTDEVFESTNKLISYVLASVSNPLRFPGYMYSSIESIFSTLIPTPNLKFLTTSIAPFNNSLNEYDMLLELLNDKYKMNRVEQTKYISVLNYIIGQNLDQQEIRKGIIKSQNRIDFVPWTSNSIQLVHGKKSPFIKTNSKLSGIQISNNTSIVPVFNKILRQYDLLAKREAYLNSYVESNDRVERARVLDSFNECRETIASVVDEYKSCQLDSYLDDDILQEDEIM